MGEVTRILTAIKAGDQEAADRLVTAVYEELRRLAEQRIAQEPPDQPLDATGLVHEAFIRLGGAENFTFDNRAHFFTAAGEAMRRILIDQARRRSRLKRGGDRRRLSLDDGDLPCRREPDNVEALNEALARLSATDPTKAELVRLRFFEGLTVEKAGEVLGISRATADRYWAQARLWLRHELNDSGPA